MRRGLARLQVNRTERSRVKSKAGFIALVTVVIIYNGLVYKRNRVRNAFSCIDVNLRTAGDEARENFLILRDLTRELVEGKAMYRCKRCGFGAKAHHWQCPSCKTWDSVRPIHGIVGE